MATNLPCEILLEIFKHMNSIDLLHCLHVCHSWYYPAHVNLLKDVTLKDSHAIHQFIAYFDRNPYKPYKNAVKTLRIWGELDNDLQQTVLERETIKRLFFRFPKLENVYFQHSNSITNFDEVLCRELLICCPNLDTFNILAHYDQEPEYGASLIKVRPLLTNLHLLCDSYLPEEMGDRVQYVTQFPRLKSLYLEEEEFSTFGVFLSILEQLSEVKTLHLNLEEDVEENFGGQYLSTKSKNVQHLIVNRLSNISYLSLRAIDDTINALTFVSQYFTGLDSFLMERDLSDWEDTQQDLFCTKAFRFIPSIKGNCTIVFNHMGFRTFADNFTALIQNIFEKVPAKYNQSNGRVLEFVIREPISRIPDLRLTLKSKQSPFSRNVTFTADNRFLIFYTRAFLHLLNGTHIDEVDVLRLRFTDIKTCKTTIDITMYLKLLETMPSLKKVELDIPASFSADNSTLYIEPKLPQVEHATFTATKRGNIQSLLNSCFYVFPNIKHLNINNYSGVWCSYTCDFKLSLQEYSLDNLVLDTKPVILELNNLMARFFVVDIDIRVRCERRLYKVSLDHSSCTMIKSCDLNGLTRNDYIHVRIVVGHLKQLELCPQVKCRHHTHSCTITLK